MNNHFVRRFEMLTRVRDFLSARADSFPQTSLGGQQLAILGQSVEDLSREAATQSSGISSEQQATVSKANAREALRDSMQAISRTARAMALDNPGLEDRFRMPRSGSDRKLLSAARAFAADALLFKDEFIRHDLPATFIEDLKADIADMERAIGGQNTGRGTHVLATAAIDEVIEGAMNAVRRLDAVVRNKFRDDPATLAAWESACHVERRTPTPRRTNGDSTDAPAPPPQ